MLQNKAVDQRQRGAANGIAMTLQSICKAIGPACGGALLSWCQKRLNAAILPVISEFGNFYPSFTSIEGVKIHFAKHYSYIAVVTPLYNKRAYDIFHIERNRGNWSSADVQAVFDHKPLLVCST
ncbi:hypothetical protein Tco_1290517 [Tanacetum coccineum]